MLTGSSFIPPFLLRSPHIQTILPSLLRSPRSGTFESASIHTSDGDSLTYRRFALSHRRLAIISHGLEGSFESSYVRGMVNAVTSSGWDALCWNMRGCGDAPNRLVSWYHSGKSDDLKAIVDHALTLGYAEIALIGFSVGGNITLKYLGEMGPRYPAQISRAAVVSVPMDLEGSAVTLARPSNRIYMEYLLRPLRRRMRHKAKQFPGVFDLRGLDQITTFREFDERFTAPFHGFSSVNEYWKTSSSREYLASIAIPTLAVSALDDPFLSPSCFPHSIAKDHPHLILETPARGGHVGFIDSVSMRSTWIERRVVGFLDQLSAPSALNSAY